VTCAIGRRSTRSSRAPALKEGEFLVRNRWLSVDPMIRIFTDRAPMGGNMPPPRRP